MKKNLYLFVPLLAVFFSSFLNFTSLDDKVFDFFLRTIPSLEENDSVLVIKVDDLAIENVGLFPWTRDILADAIVFLREMGAETVVFDLSYLDKSPLKVDPEYVNEQLPGYLDYGFSSINETVSQVMDAVESGTISSAEAGIYKQQMIDFNRSVQDSLGTSISYVTRDVDEYFGDTLRFFGNSFLTLTMVSDNDIIGEEKVFDMSPYNPDWLAENISLKNIATGKDTVTPSRIGIIPAISELLSNAAGAGFVNAEPDPDGYRRKVHLLMKHDGKYYGQLSFVPLLEKLGNPEIIVNNSHIVLVGARHGGAVKNIEIPRAQDGSIIVKWPKKEFKDYNQISAWDLIANTKQEKVFVKNLTAMEDSGFFTYWDRGESPLESYRNGEYIKNSFFEMDVPVEGISLEAYLSYRRNFIENIEVFLEEGYEEKILADIGGENSDVADYVRNFFTIAREQYSVLAQIRKKAYEKTAGAFCIVGVDATSMTDSGMITFQERFPNVGIHATVANMILSEEFLDDSPAIVSVFIALILSVSLGIVLKRFDATKSMAAGLMTLVLSVLVLLAFFVLTRRYVGVVVPFSSVSATFVSLSAINFLATIKEKSFLRSAFSRYLSPEVINEIIADPSKLNLGGEKREMTAIFTDIQGFSTISETLDPADLVKLLNLYLTDMSNIILENRGTIDKYEGDAIIAFFGAPIYMPEHAALACRTAIYMKKAEEKLNRRIQEEKLCSSTLFTRIGINTGDMVVGNMGTANKMDYTVMGNAVNLAARLEGVNKQYNTRGILVSEHTRNQTGNDFLLRRLDRVRVVGVNTPLRIYELLALAEESGKEEKALVELWEQAIELYESREFKKALGLFNEISGKDPGDRVVSLYIKRCSGFIEKEPAPDWDGVFNLTQK